MEIKHILTMDDPWKELRKDLFGNVEPEIQLEGITCPIKMYGETTATNQGSWGDDNFVAWKRIERLPALAAGTSYGSKEKLESDPERAIKLNKNLIKLGHHTPLEAIQLNFHVSGISKACGAQVSRHRIGNGHVSASRRFQEQAPRFVYPLLDYIKDPKEVTERLEKIEALYKASYNAYEWLRQDSIVVGQSGQHKDGEFVVEDMHRSMLPLHKEDARFIIPVSTATERSWWINMRAFRDFLRLRLAKDAEWEIRRLAQMMFNMIYPLMPSLLEDIKEKFE